MFQTKLQLLIAENIPNDHLQIRKYLKDSFPFINIHYAESFYNVSNDIENQQTDLILINLVRPDETDMNSFYAKDLKTAQIPVIILASAKNTQMIYECLKNSSRDYMVKNESYPDGLAGSIEKAVKRMKINKPLKEPEKQYKYLFYNNPLPICVYDEAHKFLLVNKAALNLYDYSEDEFLQLTIDELKASKAELNSLSVTNNKDQSHEGDDYKTNLHHYKKNNEIIDVEIKSQDIIFKGQKACLTVIYDVTQRNCATKELQQTEHKRIETEKELLIEKLMQANSEHQQFSYITSHNLRSPLSNLLGLIQLLDISSIPDANTVMLLRKFEECTLKLNDMVNDLVNILVIKNNVNSNKEKVDIKKTFEKVIQSVETVIKLKNVCIITDFSQVCEVNFNRVYLESILLNLVTNAVKYCSPKRTPIIKITTEKVDDGVKMHFSDNGLGIDLITNKNRIFGLYQRFHDNTDSVGLGLYMVNTQLHAMGGEIDVKSEVDKGTTFIITFKNQ